MDTDILKKVALLLISESPYEADVDALQDFMDELNIENKIELEEFLRDKLGDEYPTELPSSFMWGDGL